MVYCYWRDYPGADLRCFCFFFCLDAKETKNQGKHHRSAGFSLPARGKSRWIIYKGRCGYFVMQAGNSISGFVFLALIRLIAKKRDRYFSFVFLWRVHRPCMNVKMGATVHFSFFLYGSAGSKPADPKQSGRDALSDLYDGPSI